MPLWYSEMPLKGIARYDECLNMADYFAHSRESTGGKVWRAKIHLLSIPRWARKKIRNLKCQKMLMIKM